MGVPVTDISTTLGQAHGQPTLIAPLLQDISAQAAQADKTRSLSPELIAKIKQNDIMRLPASRELSGLDGTMVQMGNELRAIAPRCGSTAWCLWNHLVTFHHFAGLLGPDHADALRDAVAKRQWFCFPAGASSEVLGTESGDIVSLSGKAAFGSGGRYADWAGVVFATPGREDLRFALADLRRPEVRIDETWNGMSLRASATDDLHYQGLKIPLTRVVPWPMRHRDHLRDPKYPVVGARYREDWVGVTVMLLGAMATGIAEATLRETASGIRDRIAILGVRMADRPTVHVNLGKARALVNAATDTTYAAMNETDARIKAGAPPTEADYFRQTGAGMQAVTLCEEAMKLILRVLGGNGLREGTVFERRFRDFQAMPLHILGHVDRITEQTGRIALGLDSQNPL
jgi:alkylation response protein AidB-like acyl-CoA dehydrogenase